MTMWQPGDPWPDTTFAGGAIREGWGGYCRFFLQAQIASGSPFRLGANPNDQLNKGNVLSQAGGLPLAGGRAQQSGLWVDLTCDLTEIEIVLGAPSSSAGILSNVDAGTLTATLYDPDGKYDPFNPDTPYALFETTRLIPGSPIRSFVEIMYDLQNPTAPGAVKRHALFTGTADRWQHNWTKEPSERFAKLTASDTVKSFVKYDQPEQPDQGQGEYVAQRIQRIVNFFGWNGQIRQGAPGSNLGHPLQSTTLAQTGWELLNRTIDDELGFVYFAPALPTSEYNPTLTWYNRDVWQYTGDRRFTIGCGADRDRFFDICTEAVPAAFDALLHNSVHAARSGGSMQTAINQQSIDRFDVQDLQRTDLGLRDDPEVALWAQKIVALQAFPQTALDHVVLQPALDPRPWVAWENVLIVDMPSSVVGILWEQGGYTVETTFRVIGEKHTIDPETWQVEWLTVSTSLVPAGQIFTLGPDPQDRLNAGFKVA